MPDKEQFPSVTELKAIIRRHTGCQREDWLRLAADEIVALTHSTPDLGKDEELTKNGD